MSLSYRKWGNQRTHLPAKPSDTPALLQDIFGCRFFLPCRSVASRASAYVGVFLHRSSRRRQTPRMLARSGNTPSGWWSPRRQLAVGVRCSLVGWGEPVDDVEYLTSGVAWGKAFDGLRVMALIGHARNHPKRLSLIRPAPQPQRTLIGHQWPHELGLRLIQLPTKRIRAARRAILIGRSHCMAN